MLPRQLLYTILLVCMPLIAAAEDMTVQNGDDTFVSGDTVLLDMDSSGDTFVAAEASTLSGTTLGDLHVAGFDVSVRTEVAEDLYAAGATVDVRSKVMGDVSAAGFTVRTSPSAETSGNARLAGNTVTIEGPVDGALSVAGRTVILNAPVRGDVRITAANLSFGEHARVDGVLRYSSGAQVKVPESVAPEARVQFTRTDFDGDWSDLSDAWNKADMPVLPTVISVFSAFVISLLFFMLLAALALAFAPEHLERMRARIAMAPGRSMLMGVVGLSVLFGLVPITLLTIVGLPFVPFIVLAIIVAWTLGYALGAYAVAMYVWDTVSGEANPNTIIRVLLLAVTVSIVALLNFIPFVGWAANYTLVLIGIGAFTQAFLARFIDDPDAVLDVDMKPASD